MPTDFTEAQRLAFYRAMTVLNLLIEMKLPADWIRISIVDGNASSDSSQYRSYRLATNLKQVIERHELAAKTMECHDTFRALVLVSILPVMALVT